MTKSPMPGAAMPALAVGILSFGGRVGSIGPSESRLITAQDQLLN